MIDLQVTASGATPVQVMKVVRRATRLPLREVKNMVDRPPFTLVVEKAGARHLSADLERAGATVTRPGRDALLDIERLAALHADGVLTAEEFTTAKQELLARV